MGEGTSRAGAYTEAMRIQSRRGAPPRTFGWKTSRRATASSARGLPHTRRAHTAVSTADGATSSRYSAYDMVPRVSPPTHGKRRALLADVASSRASNYSK